MARPTRAGDSGAVDVTATLGLEQGRLAITDLNGVASGGTLSGTLALETERVRPYLSGTLRTSDLDLGGLVLRPEAASASPAAAPAPPMRGRSGRAPPRRSRRRREGPAGRRGQAARDRPRLERDADRSVAAAARRCRRHGGGRPSSLPRACDRAEPTRAGAEDNVAKLTLQDTLLYGGRGRGVLTFDASGQEPATSTELTLDNVLFRPPAAGCLGP